MEAVATSSRLITLSTCRAISPRPTQRAISRQQQHLAFTQKRCVSVLNNTHSNSRKTIAPAPAAAESAQPTASSPAFTGWEHVLLAVVDHHSLADSLETAVGIAVGNKSKLSVLFLTEEGDTRSEADRMILVQGHLEKRGIKAADISILEEKVEHTSGKVSVAIGEVADAVAADLVILNTSAVHEHSVDANLLAEMVPSMVLLLP